MKSQLSPELEIQMFDYIQADKVNRLYNQITERVEKSSSKRQDSEKSKSAKGEGGVGQLVTQLGLKLSLTGDVGSKNIVSEETTYEISLEHKLRAVWRYLYIEKRIANLNEFAQKKSEVPSSISIVKFEGKKAGFTLVEPKANPHDAQTLIRVHCNVEDYEVEFFCSRGYFQGSALIYDIQEAISRDILGIASVKSINHRQKKISLNPIAF